MALVRYWITQFVNDDSGFDIEAHSFKEALDEANRRSTTGPYYLVTPFFVRFPNADRTSRAKIILDEPHGKHEGLSESLTPAGYQPRHAVV